MKKIICFGEVLWDLLPTGKVAGGAPMNVAFHLNQFGMDARMISRIGNDDLGQELIRFFQNKNIATDLIQTDESHPTGIVNVMLDGNGSPSYEIVQPVAYDFIEVDEQLEKEVSEADVFIFGSLAARSMITQQTLLRLLEKARLKILDVNLRAPFFSKNLLETLLQKANIVKMNDEEIEIISDWFTPHKEGLIGRMRGIKDFFNLHKLIVTRGENGAACLDEMYNWYEHDGFSVKVQDTIGSGDSFLAAFVSKMLQSEKMENCLEFACATGAFVASKQGGTPEISEIEIDRFFNKINV